LQSTVGLLVVGANYGGFTSGISCKLQWKYQWD